MTAGTTTDATWAAALVPPLLSTAFLTSVRRASVLAQLAVQPVPFGVQLTIRSAGASSAWVGEGLAKPVSQMGFGARAALTVKKASSIVVITKDLATLAAPGSEAALQRILENEIVAFTDNTLLGAGAGSASTPAGILNGVTASADAGAAVAALFAARPAAAPVWIVAPAKIGALAALDRNVPGSYLGLPIVQSPSAGPNLILFDGAGVAVADGGLDLSATDEAAVQMDSAPASPPVAATVFRSLWQENLVGLRAERMINRATDTGAVQFAVLA